MLRVVLFAGLAAAMSVPAAAQTWAPWYQPSLLDSPGATNTAPKAKRSGSGQPTGPTLFGSPFSGVWNEDDNDDDDDDEPRRPEGPKLVDGGPRPDITPQSPSVVAYNSGQAPGTIVIDTAARRLYLVQANSTALSYPVSVGREGFAWTGTEKITRVANWPDWHPPAEMRKRDPRLPEKMTGGVRNPLGAKALYLGNTLYRIHGTSDARSIGRAASSGCFRMHNKHVVDLARRVGIGTKVVVVAGSRSRTARN
jgi:lipoprotein-anchoring transpeptidase ErfK/SrfK